MIIDFKKHVESKPLDYERFYRMHQNSIDLYAKLYLDMFRYKDIRKGSYVQIRFNHYIKDDVCHLNVEYGHDDDWVQITFPIYVDYLGEVENIAEAVIKAYLLTYKVAMELHYEELLNALNGITSKQISMHVQDIIYTTSN